jgi:hypothetical protein
MTDQTNRIFPVIYSFEGQPSDDSSMFLVEATAFDGSVVRFAIPLDNIQHFVAFLLVWSRATSSGGPSGDQVERSDNERLIPIPATSIAIGQPQGKEAFLGIAVGRAELLFSLPASSLRPVGQTLMLAAEPLNATAT